MLARAEGGDPAAIAAIAGDEDAGAADGDLGFRAACIALEHVLAHPAGYPDDTARERYSALCDQHAADAARMARLRPLGERLQTLERDGVLPVPWWCARAAARVTVASPASPPIVCRSGRGAHRRRGDRRPRADHHPRHAGDPAPPGWEPDALIGQPLAIVLGRRGRPLLALADRANTMLAAPTSGCAAATVPAGCLVHVMSWRLLRWWSATPAIRTRPRSRPAARPASAPSSRARLTASWSTTGRIVYANKTLRDMWAAADRLTA
jgi:hypothetical protein